MSTLEEAEANVRFLLEKLHGHVDSLFGTVSRLLSGPLPKMYDDVEAALIAVEELRNSVALEALLLIARWQLMGRDLTRAEGYVRASYDMYRIARYLREIVGLNKIVGPLANLGLKVEELGKARRMVNDAVNAFLRSDKRLAERVMEADLEIDEYYAASLKELSREPVTRRAAVEALFARHIERIADHATYIAQIVQ